MIALGTGIIRHGNLGPALGRTYRTEDRRGIMAKAKEAWLGLTKGSSGTYIRPTFPGYEYGRWTRLTIPLVGDHCRFEHLGYASTVEAARGALDVADKAAEARSRQLNKRRRR